MTKLVNTNAHAVRVRDNSGALPRVVPGQVVEASGDYADRLNSTAGVEEATDQDVRAWEERQSVSAVSPDKQSQDSAAATRSAARAHSAAAASVVRGDDQAPHGPPTGTVTTRQALADEEPRKFAPNEAIQSGEAAEGADVAGKQSGGKVHNRQLAAEEAVAEEASKLAELAESGGGDDAEPEEEPERDEAAQQRSGGLFGRGS